MCSQARSFVFWGAKKDLWEAALSATRTGGDRDAGTVEVNIMQSSEMAVRGKVDKKLRASLFGQVFQALKGRDSKYLRVPLDTRAWSIKMVGFNSIDAGGPYREVLDKICGELQSPVVSIFKLLLVERPVFFLLGFFF